MKGFVLLSGGIDSTTCLYLAYAECVEGLVAINVHYGQRHVKELEHAQKSCNALNIPHHTIDLSGVVPRTMLTDPSKEVPNISYDQISGISPTYVPFRNGLMLSAAATYAMATIAAKGDGSHEDEHRLYFGAHAEDAQNWAYPDCTPEFTGAMANAIMVGTYWSVRLVTPLQFMDKAQIIEFGTKLGVRWEDTWSCYKGGEMHCGVCPTCRARKSGFARAQIFDPTVYAEA